MKALFSLAVFAAAGETVANDTTRVWVLDEVVVVERAAKYQINYGFPMPRATVMAGMEWNF